MTPFGVSCVYIECDSVELVLAWSCEILEKEKAEAERAAQSCFVVLVRTNKSLTYAMQKEVSANVAGVFKVV